MFSDDSAIDYLETKESLIEWISRAEQYYADVEKTYVEKLQQGNAKVEIVLSYFVIDGYTRFLQVADIGIQDRLSKTDEKLCSLRI